MTIANVLQTDTSTSSYTLPPALMKAQAAMQLPEVQDMLRRLSGFQLGIFMPHQHDSASGELQLLPAGVMQVESGLAVCFQGMDEIANQPKSFLPVGWRWQAGALMVVAACEMVESESIGSESDLRVKHEMARPE